MYKKILFLIFFLSFLLFFSCRNRRYLYVDKAITEIKKENYHSSEDEYHLQPYDYLFIKISSTNEDINKLYENISSQYSPNQVTNQASFFLTGYLVNDSGYVFVPTLGNLYVKGLTIAQARDTIQAHVDKILKDAVVNVRLTSFNVSFIGEFNNTGQMPFYKERVNILEAIAKSGDLTDYADRRHIQVIRPIDTTYVIYNIDLTNKRILEQKEFYIFPNDIIYAPPKKTKEFTLFIKDYSVILSTLASTIGTTLLIVQLFSKK